MTNSENPQNHTLLTFLNAIKSDEINDGLADTFDGSLSGLGFDINSYTYNMSDALHALPKFKEEGDSSKTSPESNPAPRTIIISSEEEKMNLDYELIAATSAATKETEETLTYLNQGQPYELKLTRLENDTSPLQSIIRVMFHERRMQYCEKEQLDAWKVDHPGLRFVDVDIPLSLGINDLLIDPNLLNAITVNWTLKTCSVFIKVHCISTEFTLRKHGGEKGVPFRVQVETYTDDGDRLVSCSACQVKVFKPKGADRKHKTDREKIEKKPEIERRKYRPVSNTTPLTDVPLDIVQQYLLVSQKIVQVEYEMQPSSVSTKSVNVAASPSPVEYCPMKPMVHSKITKENSVISNKKSSICENLSAESSSADVIEWLQANRFSTYTNIFENFSGSDLLRLSRDELIQICGLADGIRLDNSLQTKHLRPRLTIFICQETKTIERRSSDRNGSISNSNNTSASNEKINRVRSEGSLDALNNFPRDDEDDDSLLSALQSSCSPSSPNATTNRTTRKLAKGRRFNYSSNSFKDSGPILIPTSKRHAEDDGDLSDDEVYYHKKQRKTLQISSRRNVYHAIYLHSVSVEYLKEQIAELLGVDNSCLVDIYTIESDGFYVLVTDQVVQSIKNRSRFALDTNEVDENDMFRVFLRLVEGNVSDSM